MRCSLSLYGPDGKSGLMLKMRDIIGHEDSPRQMPLPTTYQDVRTGAHGEIPVTREGWS